MTVIDLNTTEGRRFPAGRCTQNVVGGQSPVQAAHVALGVVTLDTDGGPVPWHSQEQEEV